MREGIFWQSCFSFVYVIPICSIVTFCLCVSEQGEYRLMPWAELVLIVSKIQSKLQKKKKKKCQGCRRQTYKQTKKDINEWAEVDYIFSSNTVIKKKRTEKCNLYVGFLIC